MQDHALHLEADPVIRTVPHVLLAPRGGHSAFQRLFPWEAFPAHDGDKERRSPMAFLPLPGLEQKVPQAPGQGSLVGGFKGTTQEQVTVSHP